MTFEEALAEMRKGEGLIRQQSNKSVRYMYRSNTDIVKSFYDKFGTYWKIDDKISLSVESLLANDWEIVYLGNGDCR